MYKYTRITWNYCSLKWTTNTKCSYESLNSANPHIYAQISCKCRRGFDSSHASRFEWMMRLNISRMLGRQSFLFTLSKFIPPLSVTHVIILMFLVFKINFECWDDPFFLFFLVFVNSATPILAALKRIKYAQIWRNVLGSAHKCDFECVYVSGRCVYHLKFCAFWINRLKLL